MTERKELEMIAAMVIVIMVIMLAVRMQMGAMQDLNQASASTMHRVGYKSAMSFHIINAEDSFGKVSGDYYEELDRSTGFLEWPEEELEQPSTHPGVVLSVYTMKLAENECGTAGANNINSLYLSNGMSPNYLPIPFRVNAESDDPTLRTGFRWICIGAVSHSGVQNMQNRPQLDNYGEGVGSP